MVKVGPLEVHSSNSILVEIGNPIEIEIGGESDLTLIINLVNDPNKEKFKFHFTIPKENTLEIQMYNFITKDFSNGGTAKPFKIGTLSNKTIYLSVLVNSFGNGLQTLFTYTIYL